MKVFADLHVHIGRTRAYQPVKITASDSLTLENILYEASRRKGIQVIGVVDAGSPGVQKDLESLLELGQLEPLAGGGLLYNNEVTLILGTEIESCEAQGAGHFVFYFPTLESIAAFSGQIAKYITNMQLSTQKARLRVEQLWDLAIPLGGVMIPAHVFTPFKSVYGSCCDSISQLLRQDQLARLKAVELGLSSDSELASLIGELDCAAFLSNSDAHSLAKIGREYNLLEVNTPDFCNLMWALEERNGCRIAANFGFDPKLGKYHRTFCELCGTAKTRPPVLECPTCGSKKVVRGVLDRITQLAKPGIRERPPYIHQVPLEFLPGLGPKTLEKLLRRFGTEMNILHQAAGAELEETAGTAAARWILASRNGLLQVNPGGGGIYGRVLQTSS